MTCPEVRWYFEDHRRDAEVRSDRGVVAEHVSTCADCARYVEEQRVLGLNLRLVRESAPAVPESLDRAVLVGYRRHWAEPVEVQSEKRSRRFLLGSPGVWGAVAAVVLAGAAVWFFSSRRALPTTEVPTANAVSVPVAPAVTPTPPTPVVRTRKNRAVAKSTTAQSEPRKQPETPIREARPLPEGFRSLMYCDRLSCGGDMDMIRVQLPASAMSRQVPGFVQTSGSVTADVLVGPDGIARGIRFEEIEF